MKIKSQQGFTLLEVLAALAISSILLIAGAELANTKVQDIKDQNTAQYQSMINSAAVRYIGSISSTITPSSTSTSPRKITFAEMSAAGFIPTSLAAATTNPYRQVPCILAYREALRPNDISALVVTEGGEDIPTGRVPGIATLIGAAGGYILPSNPTVANGVYGKWSQSIPVGAPNRCSAVTATGNHLASQLYLDTNNFTQNYLYRAQVPGFPDANTMTTPLIMSAVVAGGDVCSSAGAIARDSSGSLMVCSGSPLTYKGVGSNFWKDPVANFATLNTAPFACSAAKAGETRVAKSPSVGIGPRAYTCDGAVWQPLGVNDAGNLTVNGVLTANALTVSGNSQLNTLSGNLEITPVATRNTGCAPNGRLARDATGLILSCQSGTWQAIQGDINPTQIVNNAEYAGDTGPQTNSTGRPIFVTAHGGEGNPYCPTRNNHQLAGYVNGVLLSETVDNANAGYHTSSIYLMVPNGAAWRVTSYPYLCAVGRIYINVQKL